MSTPHHPNQPASETLPVANSETPSNQSRPQLVQAAHLSDKEPTIVPLAEGTKSPRPPVGGIQMAKSRRPKKKTNQFDFRADDDTSERIFRRVEQAKCLPSEAIRQLIEDGDTLATRIIISPRTPPQQLESFLGALKGWRYDFQAVRSRLNAPIPQKPEDAELIEQVKKWRETAENLHEKIRGLLSNAEATLKLMTELTPERISMLRQSYPKVVRWAKERSDKANTSENPAEKSDQESMAYFYNTIADIIADMGFVDDRK